MPRSARRFLALPLVALAFLAIAAPVSAAGVGDTWPVQSLGDRGTNVTVIQRLLQAHGRTVDASGNFGPSTKSVVRAFQSAHGIGPDGVVRSTTWTALIVPLKVGSTGPAVNAIKTLLNAKRSAKLVLDGRYGTATRDAVETFQRHYGMTVTGTANNATWRRLVAHFEYATFGHGLCDYNLENGKANWGTSAAIAQMETAAASFVALGKGGIALGDVSFQHGGDIPGHQTHEQGLDLDIRPVRDRDDQCHWGTNWHYTSYDRTATRQMIKAIRAAAPGHVKLIYFNDPVLIGEGLTVHFTGHDDHLHVRFCEVSHPVSMYRC